MPKLGGKFPDYKDLLPNGKAKGDVTHWPFAPQVLADLIKWLPAGEGEPCLMSYRNLGRGVALDISYDRMADLGRKYTAVVMGCYWRGRNEAAR